MVKTDTELKLRDAAEQLKLARKNIADADTLRSCINSFISHARSVTFVMKTESSKNSNLLNWYEDKMEHIGHLPIMKFFNAKRVHSIHRGVVKPKQISIPFRNLTLNGKPHDGTGTITVWLFDDIQEYIPHHNGNVITLCEQYFFMLRSIYYEWLKKKYDFVNK